MIRSMLVRRLDMETTVWENRTITIYAGGDPKKGIAPEITIKIEKPQITFDSYKNEITITEAK
jgi:hypothetical protein